MFFGVLGDVHGAFDDARRAVARHPEVPFWLCVGDIASDAGRYEPLGAPVYWIHGNNDNFDAIASGDLPADLRHLDNGTAIEIPIAGSEDPAYEKGAGRRVSSGDDAGRTFGSGDDVGRTFRSGMLSVAGLGGTFAPTWYETAAHDLPHPKKGTAKATELADKRRHFVHEEVARAAQLRGIDVFLTHEAAKPFRPFPGGRGPDAGKAQINDILRAMQPRLHLFGHHHRASEQTVEGVRSIGLDLVSRSYLLVELPSLTVHLRESTGSS
jgi:Calcineurin-like phosphoesterase